MEQMDKIKKIVSRWGRKVKNGYNEIKKYTAIPITKSMRFDGIRKIYPVFSRYIYTYQELH